MSDFSHFLFLLITLMSILNILSLTRVCYLFPNFKSSVSNMTRLFSTLRYEIIFYQSLFHIWSFNFISLMTVLKVHFIKRYVLIWLGLWKEILPQQWWKWCWGGRGRRRWLWIWWRWRSLYYWWLCSTGWGGWWRE